MTHTEAVRLTEIEIVLNELKSEGIKEKSILEIGSGAGWQAKKFFENGYKVTAIDVPESIYAEQKIWPILTYDGRLIPFPDNHFDIVFSSSVLEHIPRLDEFENEIRRVLKPHGLAMHIVPSASWRFWTMMAHYPFMFKTVVKIIYDKLVKVAGDKTLNEMENFALAQMRQNSILELIKKAIFPQRHGENGTALSEIYLFRKSRWLVGFERTNWKVEKVFSNRMFYTGYMILGSTISISCRQRLSYVLGSSCHIFKLRIANGNQ